MARQLYTDEGGFLTEDRAMTIAFGRAYGGSTVVYTGHVADHHRADRRALGRAGARPSPTCIARSRKYLGENHVHLLDAADINDNNRLFDEGCRRLGYRVEQFPLNLRGAAASGLCNLGCPNARQDGHAPRPVAGRRAAGRRRWSPTAAWSASRIAPSWRRSSRARRRRAVGVGAGRVPHPRERRRRLRRRHRVAGAAAALAAAARRCRRWAATSRATRRSSSSAQHDAADHELLRPSRRATTAITSPSRTGSCSRRACTSRSRRRRA